MKLLVTGAQGFVARYFIAGVLQDDPSVEVFGIGRSPRVDDAFTHHISWGPATVAAPLPATLRRAIRSDRYHYHAVGLERADALRAHLRDVRPDAIVHLASGLRDDDPAHLVGTNIAGSIRLIEAVAAAELGVRIVLMGSTGGVYGVPASVPIDESADCRPVDLYSATKLGAEHVARVVARSRRIPVLWARIFNIVGAGQDERHVCGRLAAQAAAIAKGLRPPTMEVGSLDPTRDFIDVRDVARALGVLLARGLPGEVYNVASGEEASVREVLRLTLGSAGIEASTKIAAMPPRADDIPRHFADVRKLAALGFERGHALAESIADVVGYYLTEVAAVVRSA